MQVSKLGRIPFNLLLALVATGWGVFAQTTGDIRGTVTDPSGAVIAGAQVSAVLKGEGTERHAATENSGQYTTPTMALAS